MPQPRLISAFLRCREIPLLRTVLTPRHPGRSGLGPPLPPQRWPIPFLGRDFVDIVARLMACSDRSVCLQPAVVPEDHLFPPGACPVRWSEVGRGPSLYFRQRWLFPFPGVVQEPGNGSRMSERRARTDSRTSAGAGAMKRACRATKSMLFIWSTRMAPATRPPSGKGIVNGQPRLGMQGGAVRGIRGRWAGRNQWFRDGSPAGTGRGDRPAACGWRGGGR
jgi:hypothetical protein